MSAVERMPGPARSAGRDFALEIEREVTSWEGVTRRLGRFGTVEFRFGRFVLGALPLAGLVDDERSGGEASGRDRTIIDRMRDAYERAQDALDRGAGVTA
jgi:hypothetical protein